MELEQHKFKIFLNNLGNNLLLVGGIIIFAIVVCIAVAALIGLIYVIVLIAKTVSMFLGIGLLLFSILVAVAIGTAIKGSWI